METYFNIPNPNASQFRKLSDELHKIKLQKWYLEMSLKFRQHKGWEHLIKKLEKVYFDALKT